MATKVYQVLNTGINGTVALSSTMYLKTFTAGTATAAELNAGIAVIRTFFDQLKTLSPSTNFWTAGNRVLELDWTAPATPPVIMGTTAAAVVAGTGGVQTINQAAICIAWRTATAGRRYRGRTFYGTLAATAVAGGVMSAGLVTTVVNAGTALITGLQALATPLYLSVYSRSAPAVTSIISCNTDQIPDVLRSRKR
jgi:hypothetical protein